MMIYFVIMSEKDIYVHNLQLRGCYWRLWVKVFFFFIFGKESPSPRPSSYFIRLHFRNFKQLWMFSFMIHWSWVSVLKLSRGGENRPWKRFVPLRVSNSNLRTFKDAHIHLMHTYHGIKQRPCSPLCCQLENRKWLPLKIALFQQSICSQTAHCIPHSMKLTNQNSRSRSTFGS